MEMCVLAQPVTSDRLAQMGAINALSDDVMAAAHALADRIGQGPRTAQGVIRGMIASAYEATEAQQLDTERDAMARASGGDEAAEGIAAFLEKRPPSF
jgi:enoyl-CoA hydratase/carnithine racemase